MFQLKSQPSTDAASQLQGRASGVTVVQNGIPGAGSTVRIRGLGSFNNNNPFMLLMEFNQEASPGSIQMILKVCRY